MPTSLSPPLSDSSEDRFHPPACLSCGACCFSPTENYVVVTGDDHQRLGPDAEQWVSWQNNRAFMRMTDGHCAALKIQPGANGPQFVCTIYDQRPQTCRDLGRGSPACHADWTGKYDHVQNIHG